MDKGLIGDLLEPFTIGQVTDFLTLSGHLKEKGLTIEDVREFLDWRKLVWMEGMEAGRKKREKMLRCPECGKILFTYSVTEATGKMNLCGWNTLVQCSSCVYEHYYLESPKEVIQQLMEEARRK